jgi:hypothetical protein
VCAAEPHTLKMQFFNKFGQVLSTHNSTATNRQGISILILIIIYQIIGQANMVDFISILFYHLLASVFSYTMKELKQEQSHTNPSHLQALIFISLFTLFNIPTPS